MENKKEKGQINSTAVIAIIVIVAIVFGGIGYSLAPSSPNQEEVIDYVKNASENEVKEILGAVPNDVIEEVARNTFPMMIRDDLGRGVVISEKPDNIISLTPSVTEILFALGLDNKVIGVTEFCDYPPKVPKLVDNGEIEVVAGFTTTNTEKVVSLNPSLVVTAAGTSKDTINQLEKMGIPVLGIEGENLSDAISDIELVGRATGTLEKARDITQEMRKEMNRIVEKTSDIPKNERPKVFYEIGTNPIWTAGPETFIHEIINLAGGINVAENIDRQYSSLTAEEVITMNPGVFIIAVHGTEDPLSTVKSVKDRFEGIDAVEENRVNKLSPEEIDMFSRAGPRLINALGRMTNLLHPELDIPS